MIRTTPTLRHPSHHLVALFGAASLFLATIEFLFPKPLPYMRLGLANIPLLISLRLFPIRYLYLLALLKVCAQGVLHGTFSSYVILFSLIGTLASISVMIAAHTLGGRLISLIGVSLLGALASSMTQALLAVTYIFGRNALVILPITIGTGVVGGVIVGMSAEYFWHHSDFLHHIRYPRPRPNDPARPAE